MADSSVRLARVTDLEPLASVQVAAWRASYADVLPEGFLASLDPAAIAAQWRAALLDPPVGAYRVLVALNGSRLVGYAVTAPASDPDTGARVGELVDLVVSPDSYREGHGSRLLSAAADYFIGDGFDDAVTWTPLDDEPRRAFFVSAGWGPDGAHRDLDLDGTATTLVRQVRLVTTFRDAP